MHKYLERSRDYRLRMIIGYASAASKLLWMDGWMVGRQVCMHLCIYIYIYMYLAIIRNV